MYLAGQGTRRRRCRPVQKLDDGGYIMVVLLIGMAVSAVWMGAMLPAWRQQTIRQKEAELIFRGEEYARAIALYWRKNNQTLPPSIDVLVSQRYLRKKYLDPITNKEFLTVGGLGQASPGALVHLHHRCLQPADGARDWRLAVRDLSARARASPACGARAPRRQSWCIAGRRRTRSFHSITSPRSSAWASGAHSLVADRRSGTRRHAPRRRRRAGSDGRGRAGRSRERPQLRSARSPAGASGGVRGVTDRAGPRPVADHRLDSPHDRIVDARAKRDMRVVRPCRMDAIGQQHHIQIALVIDPE